MDVHPSKLLNASFSIPRSGETAASFRKCHADGLPALHQSCWSCSQYFTVVYLAGKPKSRLSHFLCWVASKSQFLNNQIFGTFSSSRAENGIDILTISKPPATRGDSEQMSVRYLRNMRNMWTTWSTPWDVGGCCEWFVIFSNRRIFRQHTFHKSTWRQRFWKIWHGAGHRNCRR